MSAEVHAVVQNPEDLDRASACCPVQEEVTPPAPMPCDVERAQTRHDVASDSRAQDLGSVPEFANRSYESIAIDS